jgi:hypothetical protein
MQTSFFIRVSLSKSLTEIGIPFVLTIFSYQPAKALCAI